MEFKKQLECSGYEIWGVLYGQDFFINSVLSYGTPQKVTVSQLKRLRDDLNNIIAKAEEEAE